MGRIEKGPTPKCADPNTQDNYIPISVKEQVTSQKEIWKPVAGYEDYYEVSNLGNVASLNYRNTGTRKILKQSVRNGYFRVTLQKGHKQTFAVHRLVGMAFVPNPDNLSEINHLDENKANNEASNLEWCTRKHNCNYGTRNMKLSKALTNGKLSKPVEAVLPDGTVEYYPSIQEAGRQLNRSSKVISSAVVGKLKTAYGRVWKYSIGKES